MVTTEQRRISSMDHILFLAGAFRRRFGCAIVSLVFSNCLARQFHGTFARLEPSDLLGRSGNPAERAAKIWNIDHRKQQTRHPEKMDVGEEGKKAQDGDDLELQLL